MFYDFYLQPKDIHLEEKKLSTVHGVQTTGEPANTIGHARTQLELEQLIKNCLSYETNYQLDATTKFRKLLSKEKNPPIEEVIECKCYYE